MESLAPFLQGTSTPYNMPVYPGAQRIIADALTEHCGRNFGLRSSGTVTGKPEVTRHERITSG
jgi:hypothetical protein